MSDKMRFNLMFVIKIFLERKNHKHLIHIFFDGFYTTFFPRPKLRRNIINNLNSQFFRKLRNPKIKSWIINQNQNIGFIFQNVFFTKFDITQNGFQILNHFQKSHKSQITVMFDESSSLFLHQVATPKTKICVLVFLFDGFH